MRSFGEYLSGLLLALLLALSSAAPARAAIAPETCIAPLSGAGRIAREYSCARDQTAFGSGDFDVQLRFAPVISQPGDPLVLRHASLWEEGERITFHYADGFTATTSYNQSNAWKFMTVGAKFELPIPARAAPLSAIHIETSRSANWRGIVIGAELMKHSESEAVQYWLIALYAGFGGLSLALLAYNLALWAVMRHTFQLTYSAMVAAMMAYTFTSSSLAMKFFPVLENNDRLRLNYALLSLAAVCGLRFMQDYFGPKVIGARLRRVTTVASAINVAIAAAFVLFAPRFGWLLDRAYFISAAIVLSLLLPVIGAAWRARVHYFWLFLLAWSAPICVTAMRAGQGLGLFAYSFWLDNGNLLALSVESLLSTALIVTRLGELSQERDRAREGEQSALRLANSDPLTGLLNRRAFIHLAIGRTAAYRLMLVDIDHFKAINDRLGHDAGDNVLRAVAQVLQECRPADSLAVRLGGEEFALLVPLQRQRDCIPERILDAIRAKAMPLGWKVTASLGFADGKVTSEEDWKRLYRLADAALYRAKADGRDRACRATDFSVVEAA